MMDHKKKLWILRGVSGSGKTTIAKTLESSLPKAVAVAADDFWYDIEGNYNFDPSCLGKAHDWCLAVVKEMLRCGYSNVILHNTSTSESEFFKYLDLADSYGYEIVSMVVENRHGNSSVHNVPEKALKRQESRLRNSLKLR